MIKKKIMLLTGVMLTLALLGGCTRKEELVFSIGDAGRAQETGMERELTEQEAVQEQETAAQEAALPAGEPAYAYVHICGAVVTPGVYKVKADSRVYEVIELAGGLLPEACPEYRNQAQAVEDGMQIIIPTRQEVEDGAVTPAESAPAAQAESGAAALVNINTAGKEELCTLPGIGEARAESILQYRNQYGAFDAAEDIMKVEGIKEKAYLKIKDRIRVK